MYPLVLIGFVEGNNICSPALICCSCIKRLGLLSIDDRRRRHDLRTKSFKTLLSLTGSLLEKKNICIYCMREVCDFSGMGKIVCLYLMNFFVSHLVYLLIIYVFIEFYLSLSGSL